MNPCCRCRPVRNVAGVVLATLAVLIGGCATSQYGHLEQLGHPREERSSLTPGMTKKLIVKGQTTQAEVMETFGPPDTITTTASGGEMWGYDRVSREVAYGAFGLGILGGGAPGDGFVAGIAGARAGRTTQTVRTFFLLIYFDTKDRVTDYKLSGTRF